MWCGVCVRVRLSEISNGADWRCKYSRSLYSNIRKWEWMFQFFAHRFVVAHFSSQILYNQFTHKAGYKFIACTWTFVAELHFTSNSCNGRSVQVDYSNYTKSVIIFSLVNDYTRRWFIARIFGLWFAIGGDFDHTLRASACCDTNL